MKAYLAQIVINLKLTWRDKTVIFFNYMFPLIFFFIFAQLQRAEQGGAINQVFAMVLVIGVLGNGFFGGGIRAVVERETGILRRFKVAPITPAPILVSAIVVGLVNFLPAALLMFAISYFRYGMPLPVHWISALVMIVIGIVAFRAMGQIIASVANSSAESQIIIQALYFPMLFLSGATFPIAFLPGWVQTVTQFIPATHLFSGVQNILVRNETLSQNFPAVIALLLTTVLCLFISMKLFRWEKEEKVKGTAKLWILAALVPFFAIGGWEIYSKANVTKAKSVAREIRRSRSLLIRDVRTMGPAGQVLSPVSVLVRNGRIEKIFEGSSPDAKELRADPVDAQGKTLLPGLIDAQVFLSAPGGIYDKQEDYLNPNAIGRALAAYLFSGVTAVLSGGESSTRVAVEERRIQDGERLGATALWTGPLFTAKGGRGTENFRFIPGQAREMVEKEFTRSPNSAGEARQMVRDLKAAGAIAIKAALDSGVSGHLVNRLEPQIFRAIAEESAAQKLPLMVVTGDSKDVEEAIAAGAAVIVGSSQRDRLSDGVIQRIIAKKTAWLPMLAVHEAETGNPELLERSLVQQVGPAALLTATKRRLPPVPGGVDTAAPALEIPMDNLRRFYGAGGTVVAGSGGGSFLVVHGPGIHRELQLWVKAGLPAHAALQGATSDAAKLLGIGNRVGAIQTGLEATMLLVNGNPFQDIAATEAISLVIYKGERINRSELFEEENR